MAKYKIGDQVTFCLVAGEARTGCICEINEEQPFPYKVKEYKNDVEWLLVESKKMNDQWHIIGLSDEGLPPGLPDSGKRQEFTTGSVRDDQTGKGRFDLIPLSPLRRIAQRFEDGAIKYDEKNWQLGQPLSRLLNSAIRHTYQAKECHKDEDHPAAAAWNMVAFMWMTEQIEKGELDKELDDIGWLDG